MRTPISPAVARVPGLYIPPSSFGTIALTGSGSWTNISNAVHFISRGFPMRGYCGTFVMRITAAPTVIVQFGWSLDGATPGEIDEILDDGTSGQNQIQSLVVDHTFDVSPGPHTIALQQKNINNVATLLSAPGSCYAMELVSVRGLEGTT